MPENANFSERLDKITPEILSKIAQIEVLKEEWIAGARLNPQVLGRLKKSVLRIIIFYLLSKHQPLWFKDK